MAQQVRRRVLGTALGGLVWGSVVFTGACAQAQNLPGWFTNPPADSAEAWFAVGEGPDPETARRMALRAVAARMRTAIEGKVTSEVTDANGVVKRRDSVKVSEDVLKTEFTKVDIANTVRTSQGVMLQVRVDRPAFIRDTQAQLEVAAKPVLEAEAAVQGASTLDQYLALKRVLPDIEKAANLGLLLVGAGDEAVGRQHFARYSALKQRTEALATRMVFEVRARPEDADIAKVVAGSLADRGMRSASGPTAGAAVMTVDTTQREVNLGSDKLVRLVVRFSVVDDQGRAVASREHQLSGASRYDHKGAREAAVTALANTLKRSTSLAPFGFKD
jgi:hypothetical protein